jgi:hypothetical protein
MKTRYRASLACLAILTLVPPVSAQRRFCWQPAPKHACGTFALTEFGGGLLIAGNQPDNRWALFQYGLGAMANVSDHIGIGGVVLATYSEEIITVGIAPKFRIWVAPSVSFDAAPGLVVFQGGSRNLGFNGQVGVNVGPYVSFQTTLQLTNQDFRHFARAEWFAGLRFNGTVGTATGITVPVLTILTYLAFFAPRST